MTLFVPQGGAQKYEWIYKFPTVTPSISLPESSSQAWEFGIFETGLVYKERWGISIGQSLIQHFIPIKTHVQWFAEEIPDWERFFTPKYSLYYIAKSNHMSCSYRLINGKSFCLESNILIGLNRQYAERIRPTAVYQRTKPEGPGAYSSGWIFSNGFRKPRLGAGLHAEMRLGSMWLFCNVMASRLPRLDIEVDLYFDDYVITNEYQVGAPLILQFETGIRMRVDKPFSFIRIK